MTKEGISVDPEKIKEIKEWLVPKDVTDLRSFMGITGYYRRVLKNCKSHNFFTEEREEIRVESKV